LSDICICIPAILAAFYGTTPIDSGFTRTVKHLPERSTFSVHNRIAEITFRSSPF
jgi:hypothetical protein